MEYNRDQSTYELVAEWLKEYHSSSDRLKRAKSKTLIVTKMLPIIKKIARTIARRSYDPIEDMVQAGSVGLLKAIDSYSSHINDNFKIYAGYLIIGEMKHFLRDKANTIRIPGHIQELLFRINSFTSTLTREELNELTNEDVADILQIPKKDVDMAFQVDRRSSTVSLDEIFAADNDNLGYEEVLSGGSYEEYRDLEDTKIQLREVIEKLPDEQKALIKMYYYEDMSQKEIAEKLNFSQMQISRRMKKAFSMLYKMLADSEVLDGVVKND